MLTDIASEIARLGLHETEATPYPDYFSARKSLEEKAAAFRANASPEQMQKLDAMTYKGVSLMTADTLSPSFRLDVPEIAELITSERLTTPAQKAEFISALNEKIGSTLAADADAKAIIAALTEAFPIESFQTEGRTGQQSWRAFDARYDALNGMLGFFIPQVHQFFKDINEPNVTDDNKKDLLNAIQASFPDVKVPHYIVTHRSYLRDFISGLSGEEEKPSFMNEFWAKVKENLSNDNPLKVEKDYTAGSLISQLSDGHPLRSYVSISDQRGRYNDHILQNAIASGDAVFLQEARDHEARVAASPKSSGYAGAKALEKANEHEEIFLQRLADPKNNVVGKFTDKERSGGDTGDTKQMRQM